LSYDGKEELYECTASHYLSGALLGRDVCLIAGSTDCMLALISPDFSSAEITVIRNDCANVF